MDDDDGMVGKTPSPIEEEPAPASQEEKNVEMNRDGYKAVRCTK